MKRAFHHLNSGSNRWIQLNAAKGILLETESLFPHPVTYTITDLNRVSNKQISKVLRCRKKSQSFTGIVQSTKLIKNLIPTD